MQVLECVKLITRSESEDRSLLQSRWDWCGFDPIMHHQPFANGCVLHN